MEKFSAAYSLLAAIAKHFGDFAGHVGFGPLHENVADIDFDQYAEVTINGLKVTAHSQSGKEWPVYVQLHTGYPMPAVIGSFTPESESLSMSDIAMYAGIYG